MNHESVGEIQIVEGFCVLARSANIGEPTLSYLKLKLAQRSRSSRTIFKSLDLSPIAIYGYEIVEIGDAITAVKSWFHGHEARWLVVLDNADTIGNDRERPGGRPMGF